MVMLKKFKGNMRQMWEKYVKFWWRHKGSIDKRQENV